MATLCYYLVMRQRFDIGDLVQVHKHGRGLVMETRLLNANMTKPEEWIWHVDEYTCKVKLLQSSEITWVRAKWLKHLSKINQ